MSGEIWVLVIVAALVAFAVLDAGTGFAMTKGTKLSASQIASLAQAAGFVGADAVTAVAIAFAESGGNPNATGDNGNSFGLWQIDMKYHPEFAGQNLYDPATNAAAAYSVYSAAGGSFTPWSTFNNGKYNAFVSTANQAVNA